jgi:hypothetical protein
LFRDCPDAQIIAGPMYQLPFSIAIKKAVPDMLVGAVG